MARSKRIMKNERFCFNYSHNEPAHTRDAESGRTDRVDGHDTRRDERDYLVGPPDSWGFYAQPNARPRALALACSILLLGYVSRSRTSLSSPSQLSTKEPSKPSPAALQGRARGASRPPQRGCAIFFASAVPSWSIVCKRMSMGVDTVTPPDPVCEQSVISVLRTLIA